MLSTAPNKSSLFFLTDDLRLDDNPTLKAASQAGPLIVVFALPPQATYGAASRWWLHHSLEKLQTQLRTHNVPLILRLGHLRQVAKELWEELGTQAPESVFISRSMDAGRLQEQNDLGIWLAERQVPLRIINSGLLFAPEDLKTKEGETYKVFTPFWRQVRSKPLRQPISAPSALHAAASQPQSKILTDLALLPTIKWDAGFQSLWIPGEQGAKSKLHYFLKNHVVNYEELRNRPDTPEGTSRLSPHLRFGEISPIRIWYMTLKHFKVATIDDLPKGAQIYLSEIAWREFSYNALASRPDLGEKPVRAIFSNFPWEPDTIQLHAWQRGMTGYPIVDAGMRELWQTGFMHNRVRMIVGSFLVKDLLQPWQDGERWFWNTLLDADRASNAQNWQWIAGCGFDAAPYFRVFNPILQSEKFDPQGRYIRRYVPEVATLEDKWLHAPWTAPAASLQKAGIKLGKTYPKPIVDHGLARLKALRAHDRLKKQDRS